MLKQFFLFIRMCFINNIQVALEWKMEQIEKRMESWSWRVRHDK